MGGAPSGDGVLEAGEAKPDLEPDLEPDVPPDSDVALDSAPDVAPDLEPEQARWLGVALAVGTIAAGGALVLGVPELRHVVSLVLHGDLAGMRRHFLGMGAGGVLLLFALMQVHAVLFYPAEIVSATAGFVYGFFPGLGLAMVGWVVSAGVSYLLGRALGRPLLHRLFGVRRLAALEQLVERGGALLLIAARLIPILPFSLTGYVAGAMRIPVWRFCWTTFVGYLPLTAAVGYLGSRAESLSVSDVRVWVAGAVLVALLGTSRLVRPRRVDPARD
ncbi:MAG TPA: VTT domain-containing protein [Solirubrobacteraceae bacterium]|nr:VTT domain-containing protein [Solirubrobacteraceae bacterium]